MNTRYLKFTDGKLLVAVEVLLYLLFLSGDLMGKPTDVLKYVAICLCLLASLRQLREKQWMIPAAMAVTLVADTFLLLLNSHYEIGVMAFCIVQTIYAIKLGSRVTAAKTWWMIRAAVFGAALIGLGLAHQLDLLTALAAYSFSQLTVSAVQGWRQRGQSPQERLLAAGLVLFWGCDLCVGLHNIAGYWPQFPLPGLLPAASFCMWLFYLPAQVLIVLSGFSNINSQVLLPYRRKRIVHETK